jgi:hypothetical protein
MLPDHAPYQCVFPWQFVPPPARSANEHSTTCIAGAETQPVIIPADRAIVSEEASPTHQPTKSRWAVFAARKLSLCAGATIALEQRRQARCLSNQGCSPTPKRSPAMQACHTRRPRPPTAHRIVDSQADLKALRKIASQSPSGHPSGPSAEVQGCRVVSPTKGCWRGSTLAG